MDSVAPEQGSIPRRLRARLAAAVAIPSPLPAIPAGLAPSLAHEGFSLAAVRAFVPGEGFSLSGEGCLLVCEEVSRRREAASRGCGGASGSGEGAFAFSEASSATGEGFSAFSEGFSSAARTSRSWACCCRYTIYEKVAKFSHPSHEARILGRRYSLG